MIQCLRPDASRCSRSIEPNDSRSSVPGIAVKCAGIRTGGIDAQARMCLRRRTARIAGPVLPRSMQARVAVEPEPQPAGSSGWVKTALSVGVDSFGKSAPYQYVYEHFGLTAENVAAMVESVIAGVEAGPDRPGMLRHTGG